MPEAASPTPSVVPDYLLPHVQPADIPGLVAYWHFTSSGDRFTATQGNPYTLHSQVGPLTVVPDPSAPLGGSALHIPRGTWLNIPRRDCPGLDIHGPTGHLTVVAWLKRAPVAPGGCEFIAGQWNESQKGRQYGLFLNIGVWRQPDQICGHLSHVGGPTPGYKYCIDGAMGATPIPRDEWHTIAMAYDGQAGFAYLDGVLDARPGLNPYPMAGGLNNGGPTGSDFTVGAVDRSGEIGNFFAGHLAGLAVYNRSLTPAEHYVLAQQ